MGEIHNTQFFRAVQEKKMDVSQVLELVYAALREKGYNPVNQIVEALCPRSLAITTAGKWRQEV